MNIENSKKQWQAGRYINPFHRLSVYKSNFLSETVSAKAGLPIYFKVLLRVNPRSVTMDLVVKYTNKIKSKNDSSSSAMYFFFNVMMNKATFDLLKFLN